MLGEAVGEGPDGSYDLTEGKLFLLNLGEPIQSRIFQTLWWELFDDLLRK
jgi:hypothetical protein